MTFPGLSGNIFLNIIHNGCFQNYSQEKKTGQLLSEPGRTRGKRLIGLPMSSLEWGALQTSMEGKEEEALGL